MKFSGRFNKAQRLSQSDLTPKKQIKSDPGKQRSQESFLRGQALIKYFKGSECRMN